MKNKKIKNKKIKNKRIENKRIPNQRMRIYLLLALLAYLIVAVFFIAGFYRYQQKPESWVWDDARDYLIKSTEFDIREPVVFKPGWLENYASDWGRIRQFNVTECDSCNSFWLFTNKRQIPSGYERTHIKQFDGLYLLKLQKRGTSHRKYSWLFNMDPLFEIRYNNTAQKCSMNGSSMELGCFEHDWEQVHKIDRTSLNENKFCLFVHPRAGKNVSVVYDIELGDSLEIISSISDDMTKADLSPVNMFVYVGNELIGTMKQQDDPGWNKHIFSTEEYKGQKISVEFVINAENVQGRHFCFDGFVNG